MLTIFSFLFLSMLPGAQLEAQPYAVANIPEPLKEQANVVKRMEKTHFDVINHTNTVLKRKYALTILNEQGAEFADFVLHYSKLSSLKSFNGALYDANGTEIQKIKWKDLKDESAVSGGNLMDDYRVKRYTPYHRNYPYTILYEYEEQNNNSLFFENWQPVLGERFSVEQSAFTISFSKGTKIRYKGFNYTNEPLQKEEKGKEFLTWEVKDLKAIKYEPYGKSIYELTPSIMTGPEEFQIEGYRGNMATWESFGKFVYALIKDRQALPTKVKDEVRYLTKDLTNEYDKISVLYRYLQRNTRYISIQLGIGGWQPFDATYVANNAYGDCKALVNYMHSLLREVGISSHYTLIRAGNTNRKIVTDLPSQQFNHAVLCVPLQQDTVWLECTSQTLPVGYLSTFTENRYGLLVSPEGGKLVLTPKHGITENSQIRSIQAKFGENGNLQLQVKTAYSGLQQDDVHKMISYLTKDKIKERLNKSLPLSTYEVTKFDYTPETGRLPFIKEELDIIASGYAHTTGKRLIIEPNILSKMQGKLPKEARLTPIVLNYPYMDIDSIQIDLPSNYTLETSPENTEIESKFGRYSMQITVEKDKILCTRSMTQLDGEYPASDYEMLMAFYDAVHRADRKQVVLVRKD